VLLGGALDEVAEGVQPRVRVLVIAVEEDLAGAHCSDHLGGGGLVARSHGAKKACEQVKNRLEGVADGVSRAVCRRFGHVVVLLVSCRAVEPGGVEPAQNARGALGPKVRA